MSVPSCSLERQCVDFLQRTLIELCVDPEPVLFLCIHVVVLGGSHDGVALNTLNIASRHLPCEHRFLPQSLEQATKDGDASDIQPWTEQDVVPCCPGFRAHQVTVSFSGGEIPCGGQRNRSGERRGLSF